MIHPTIFLSFLAGLVSILSPCVFPLIPAFAAYMGGSEVIEVPVSRSGAVRPIMYRSMCFVLGFSLVFIIVFYILSALEITLFAQYQHLFSLFAGVIVLLFALHFLGLISPNWIFKEWKPLISAKGNSLQGAFILGIAFAVGWTPCIGPQLGAILQLSLVGYGGLPFLLLYCIGLGIPFLAIAGLSGTYQVKLQSLNKHGHIVQKLSGTLLLLFAAILLTDSFSALSRLVPGSPFNI